MRVFKFTLLCRKYSESFFAIVIFQCGFGITPVTCLRSETGICQDASSGLSKTGRPGLVAKRPSHWGRHGET